MDSYELLALAAKKLDEMHVRYVVTGSMATMTYGEVRFTNDVDIVANFAVEHVAPVCDAFPAPEFYRSAAAVEDGRSLM